MRRTETPKAIWIKFCTVVDIPNVVTYTSFGDHRLRGFWVAVGQISPSPFYFHRRPYNTLALPCERVIAVEMLNYIRDEHESLAQSVLLVQKPLLQVKYNFSSLKCCTTFSALESVGKYA